MVGPFADSNLDKIYGSYASNVNYKYAKTPAQGLTSLAQTIVNASGCNNPKCALYKSSDVEKAVEGADMVIVCLGTGQCRASVSRELVLLQNFHIEIYVSCLEFSNLDEAMIEYPW